MKPNLYIISGMDYRHFESDNQKRWDLTKTMPFADSIKNQGMICLGIMLIMAMITYILWKD